MNQYSTGLHLTTAYLNPCLYGERKQEVPEGELEDSAEEMVGRWRMNG
ncbi:MAG: hypothetical protein ABSD72_04675 [Terracidiphilus sp.]|jgi:hypothetical protein